ncbi:PQQ-dependent sugar dehydrogenase [Xanthomonas translucens pv. graminis]|uniref:PQQ-dependent sugar dehydrogenase n=1 Tax=Xanthomonas graminis TaxID=3390026 RepID=UPI002541E309|nr:PQQ-dependent sugar dehydrogenase [Xanthomonas translucens]WIH05432.1 PQQ-dependent sugar dehydrogenase [Xanthomonas translucens pv. graminis]
MQRSSLSLVCALLLSLAASAAAAAPAAKSAERRSDWPFSVTPFATFNEPWAMSFLPDGSALITEKGGTLKRFDPASGRTGTVSGVPAVDYGGQGGFGDVLPHPDFAQNGWLYLSYVEAGSDDTRGAAVARAKLTLDANGGGALSQLQVIWRQQPKVSGTGHYGHRLAFGPDGKLWISSSERQKFDPAQDMNSNLGKIVRLNDDGSVPADNPFARRGGVAAQVWSLGHRNVLGLAFDANGQLWEHEMGPAGGDELNLIQRGANYGYPIVSNGNHYDGRPIPDHSTRPEFAAPKLSWTPVISPAGFVIYSGSAFPQWRGNGFIGGMSSQSLLRIEFDGDHAREAARYDMGKRIREVEQGPDGALWLLEDGSSGRLLKLQPVQS